MRFDDVAQLAEADSPSQFFKGGLLDAKFFGQSAAFVANGVPSWMVLLASK